MTETKTYGRTLPKNVLKNLVGKTISYNSNPKTGARTIIVSKQVLKLNKETLGVMRKTNGRTKKTVCQDADLVISKFLSEGAVLTALIHAKNNLSTINAESVFAVFQKITCEDFDSNLITEELLSILVQVTEILTLEHKTELVKKFMHCGWKNLVVATLNNCFEDKLIIRCLWWLNTQKHERELYDIYRSGQIALEKFPIYAQRAVNSYMITNQIPIMQ